LRRSVAIITTENKERVLS